MAQLKISELLQTSSLTYADLMMIVQGGQNKKITISNFFNDINTNYDVLFQPGNSGVNFGISSKNISNLFFLSGLSNSIGINTISPQSLFHVNGNIQCGGNGSQGNLIHSVEYVNYSATTDLPKGNTWYKPLNSAFDVSVITADASITTAQFDLPVGVHGQSKTIIIPNVGTASYVIQITNGMGLSVETLPAGSTATFKCVYVSGVLSWAVTSYVIG